MGGVGVGVVLFGGGQKISHRSSFFNLNSRFKGSNKHGEVRASTVRYGRASRNYFV